MNTQMEPSAPQTERNHNPLLVDTASQKHKQIVLTDAKQVCYWHSYVVTSTLLINLSYIWFQDDGYRERLRYRSLKTRRGAGRRSPP